MAGVNLLPSEPERKLAAAQLRSHFSEPRLKRVIEATSPVFAANRQAIECERSRAILPLQHSWVITPSRLGIDPSHNVEDLLSLAALPIESLVVENASGLGEIGVW
jgi:hypothetical protein